MATNTFINLYRLERVVAHDMKFRGIHLPKDTVIAIPMLGLHFDPEIYPEPEEFRPERSVVYLDLPGHLAP